jgi:Mn-dependent DtxR family transcriptional regulator
MPIPIQQCLLIFNENIDLVYLMQVSPEVLYKFLSKNGDTSLQKLSMTFDVSMPSLMLLLKKLESDGLVEVFYGKEKASIMVKAKNLNSYL